MVRVFGLLTLTIISVLVNMFLFVDCRSTKGVTNACPNTFKNAHSYHIWSLATKQFLAMKKINGNLSIAFTATGYEDGTASQGSSILKALCYSIGDANFWRYVFELHDNGTSQTYALHLTENDTFTALEVSSNTVNNATSFVPVDFCITGPFKALEVVGSGKCMAADINDGSLSLKACNKEKPHPGTILVMTEP